MYATLMILHESVIQNGMLDIVKKWCHEWRLNIIVNKTAKVHF